MTMQSSDLQAGGHLMMAAGAGRAFSPDDMEWQRYGNTVTRIKNRLGASLAVIGVGLECGWGLWICIKGGNISHDLR